MPSNTINVYNLQFILVWKFLDVVEMWCRLILWRTVVTLNYSVVTRFNICIFKHLLNHYFYKALVMLSIIRKIWRVTFLSMIFENTRMDSDIWITQVQWLRFKFYRNTKIFRKNQYQEIMNFCMVYFHKALHFCWMLN